MNNILDYNENELKKKFEEVGIKKFRASQVYHAIFEGKNLEEINTLSEDDKIKIAQNFDYPKMQIAKKLVSSDGTIKYALKLKDDNIIEAVVMDYKYGNTICISTQVGCTMGCKFCASTIGGKLRDLTAGEMLMQVSKINAELGGSVKNRKITNIVLMGCGEPLDNYENVTKFLQLVSKEGFLDISQRNISLSTCGIVENIKRLADENYKVNLTISLHAPTDEIRKKLMPVARKYSIKSILNACDYYLKKTKRRFYIEYTLCKGVNDSSECAEELAKLLKGKVCHINVINLNKVKERNLNSVSGKDANNFVNKLCSLGLSATLRRTLGQDIDGACGQLRKRIMDENDC
jgi:23S rRNA (adenine2503-C2)-methyltransferase